MSLPATDTFSGSGALDASWTNAFGGSGFLQTSGAARSQAAGSNAAYWNADAFSDDQYSSIVVGTGGLDHYAMARASGAGVIFAAYLFGSTGMYRLVGGGSFTQISAVASGAVTTDTVRLEVSGSTLRGYKNGVQVGTDISDGTFTSGASGIFAFNSNNDIDSWEGGNLGGGGSILPLVACDMANMADMRGMRG